MKYENLELCKKCGGKCCLKSGCDYSVDDFDSLSFNYLYHKLLEGNISITSSLKIIKNNNKVRLDPFLLIRARCINSGAIDLLSIKSRCSMHTINGCKYKIDERPWGGVNLIPQKDGNCYQYKDPLEEMNRWAQYQDVLSKLVKKITGNSVDEQLRYDVIKLFEKVINKDYHNVAESEINDILNLLPILAKIYPEEVARTVNKVKILK